MKDGFISALQEGVEYLTKRSERELLQETLPDLEKRGGRFSVRLLRICEGPEEGFFPALRIEAVDGQLLGTLPRCKSGEAHSTELFLNQAETTQDLLISVGNRCTQAVSSRFYFGRLDLINDQGLKWQLFRRRKDEKPYGKFSRLFIFNADHESS